MLDNQNLDVIVVGAGISGLCAAKLLMENGLNVKVIEARDRVGGRIHTIYDPVYKYCDVGGSYVGPSQNRILRVIKELNLKTYKIFCEGDSVHYSKGKLLRFQGTWPRFTNPVAWLDINSFFREMDNLLKEVPLEAPWEAPRAQEWDTMTAQQHIDRSCWTNDAKEFVRAFINMNMTVEPWEISLLWLLWYVKSAGGTRCIQDIDSGAQERKVEGGSGGITDRLADILGERVILNSPVVGITLADDVVHVHTKQNNTYKAKYLILTVPPALYGKIIFDPPLPPLKIQLSQRMPMGSCIKSTMFYSKPFWRDNNVNGSTGADGHIPVQVTMDDCKPNCTLGAMTGFIAGEQARKLVKLTPQEREKIICEFYSRLFESKEALKPIVHVEGLWMNEEFSGGCYTGTCPPGVLTSFGRCIREPFMKVHFGGTETATKWSGYMDGAVQSGERSALEIMVRLDMITQDDMAKRMIEPMSQDVPEVEPPIPVIEKLSPSVDGFIKLVSGAGALGAIGVGLILKSRL